MSVLTVQWHAITKRKLKEGETMEKLYIKDLSTGNHREYGIDRHDALVSFDSGRSLQYYNKKDGSGSDVRYRFCDQQGYIIEVNEIEGEYANIGGFHENILSAEEKVRMIELLQCKYKELVDAGKNDRNLQRVHLLSMICGICSDFPIKEAFDIIDDIMK